MLCIGTQNSVLLTTAAAQYLGSTKYYLPLQLRSVRVPGCPNISVAAAALLVTRLPRLLQLEHDKLGAVFIHLATCHRWVHHIMWHYLVECPGVESSSPSPTTR